MSNELAKMPQSRVGGNADMADFQKFENTLFRN